MTRPPRRTRLRRPGFTLVELLVVILILAILIALLVPAISAAVVAANNGRVSAEISNLGTALADFKSRYGEYPPSRIILYDNGVYPTQSPQALFNPATSGTTGDITLGDLAQRTVRAMKKYFPKAAGYFNGSVPTGFTWDVTTTNQGFVLLQGHECLVFFLGGMPTPISSSNGVTYNISGFAKDPQNPFLRNLTNRTQPLFEFSPSRLDDVFNSTLTGASGSANSFPSYIDPLSSINDPRPYAYFSAYGNNAYDPNDDNSAGEGNASPPVLHETDDQGNLLFRPFYASFLVQNATNNHAAISTPPNPYTSTDPTVAKGTWINPQTFQIISAGRDGQWGVGGGYEANSSTRLPVYPSDTFSQGLRKRESDNITNFAAGKLD